MIVIAKSVLGLVVLRGIPALRLRLVARSLPENVLQRCHLPRQSQVKVIYQKTVHSEQNQNYPDHHYQNGPSRNHVLLKFLACVCLYENPDSLRDHDQKIHRQHEQNPQKLLIIPAPNTVVQVLAVMVEVQRTPVASHAMVTLQKHITVTNYAPLYLLRHLTTNVHTLLDQRIHWVLKGQVNVIIPNEQDECVVE